MAPTPHQNARLVGRSCASSRSPTKKQQFDHHGGASATCDANPNSRDTPKHSWPMYHVLRGPPGTAIPPINTAGKKSDKKYTSSSPNQRRLSASKGSLLVDVTVSRFQTEFVRRAPPNLSSTRRGTKARRCFSKRDEQKGQDWCGEKTSNFGQANRVYVDRWVEYSRRFNDGARHVFVITPTGSPFARNDDRYIQRLARDKTICRATPIRRQRVQ